MLATDAHACCPADREYRTLIHERTILCIALQRAPDRPTAKALASVSLAAPGMSGLSKLASRVIAELPTALLISCRGAERPHQAAGNCKPLLRQRLLSHHCCWSSGARKALSVSRYSCASGPSCRWQWLPLSVSIVTWRDCRERREGDGKGVGRLWDGGACER